MNININKLKEGVNDTPMNLRQKMIVAYRYGFYDKITHTLEETGKMFGVTRERIRQIESDVFEKVGGLDKYLTKKVELKDNNKEIKK